MSSEQPGSTGQEPSGSAAKPPRKPRRKAARKKAAEAAALHKAERRLKRRGGRHGAGPGVPQAVEKSAGDGGAGKKAGRIQTPARLSADSNARVTWLLDLLAWAGHDAVAKRVDLRGSSAALPPVILPEVAPDVLVALDTVDALRRLRSRHRAFSQMAGRYSALLLAARDTGRRLRLELWDLDETGALRPADERLAKLWPQLESYLEGEVWLADEAALRARLARASEGSLPAALVRRNPVAFGLGLARPPADEGATP